MFIIKQLFINPILVIAAVVPAIVLLCYVYKKDKLEKESPGLLFKLVLFGIFSTALAAATEELGIAVLPYIVPAGGKAYNIILYFIVVGLSEEGFKYLLLKWKTWKNPEFNCQFDGVVYAIFVSLGFALWENISYVIAFGFETAVARAITAVPGHASFGVFMGAFYGAAKRAENYGMPGKSKTLRITALVASVLLHGAYDYLATEMENLGDMYFVVFVIVLFILAYRVVRRMSKNDRYIDRPYMDI